METPMEATAGGVCWNERNLCAFRPLSKGGHVCQALRMSEGSHAHTIIVFGGGDAYGVSYNDVVAIEPDHSSLSCSWRCTELQPTNAGPIHQRMGHSSVKVPCTRIFPAGGGSLAAMDSAVSYECLVLFGGWQAVPTQVCFNDCYVMALHPQWQTLIGTWKAPPLLMTNELVCTGKAPTPRHSHASCLAHGGTQMMVLGGSNNEAVLGDCFQLCLTSRVWREVVMPSHWIPREMASMVTLRDATTLEGTQQSADGTGCAVMYGGRRDGQLLDDTVLLSWNNTEPSTTSSNFGVACIPSAISQAVPVCCHTLVRLSDGCALSIGGLGPATTTAAGVRSSGASDEDALLATAPNASTRFVGVPRRQLSVGKNCTNLFGFGHSSCSWYDGKTQHHVVIDGLVPDAASGVLAVHELVWQ